MSQNNITEYELEERFDDYLNNFNTVCVGLVGESITIPASRVVKLADPTAYRTGLANYADYLERDFGITTSGYTS
jgi:hypothetical protein